MAMPWLALAQSYEEVVKQLEGKDYQKFVASIFGDNYPLISTTVYNAIPIVLMEEYRLQRFTTKPSVHTDVVFEIQIITLENTIVFAEIEPVPIEGRLSSFSDTAQLPLPPSCYIKHEPAYTLFNTKYSSFYGRAFTLSYYQNHSHEGAYGFNCGFGGINPELRNLLDKAIQTQNETLLNTWLHSSMPVLEAYAVEGLYKLHGSTCSMTAEQLKLIKLIKKSDALVSTCSGCIYGAASLKEVLKEFNFYCHK